MQKTLLFFSLLMILFGSLNVQAQQCGTLSTFNVTNIPDDCDTAADAAAFVNSCQVICLDMSQATASTGGFVPSCGSGVVTNDFWLKVTNPYDAINNYDGSLVFAWKKYPEFPNHMPTTAAHAGIEGTLTAIIIPINVDDECDDAFVQKNVACSSDSVTNIYDNQIVLPPGTLPTNDDIEQLLEDSEDLPVDITNANIQNSTTWFQFETYNNVPGMVCFEISTYRSGFSCGDPAVLDFDLTTDTSETQTVSKCLCRSAQNSGYFRPNNTPCPAISGDPFFGTTAYYQVNANYECNEISVNLTDWMGSGSVNVVILSEANCPDITTTDLNGNTINSPGLVVDAATVSAAACMVAGDAVATSGCLPAGTYYVLISGSTDKSTFSADITVSDATEEPVPTGIPVNVDVILSGAFDETTNLMRTELLTNGLLPLSQPYNMAPWNYNGTESVMTAGDFPANTVDWVLVEVQDSAYNMVEQKAGLLLNDGNIVSPNGESFLRFENLDSTAAYHVAVYHRNHAAVVSNYMVNFMTDANFLDFKNVDNVEQGAMQLTLLTNNLYGMIVGDNNGDGAITFADYNVFQAQFNQTGYLNSDCDLDGTVEMDDFDLLVEYIGHISVLRNPQ